MSVRSLTFLFLILAAVAALTDVAMADKTLHTIVIGGQSNSVGKGLLSEWPADLPRQPEKLWTFRSDSALKSVANNWQNPATPNYQRARVGPAVPIADHLATLRPGTNWGIIPCGKGGTSIAFWNQRGKGSLYRNCIDQVKRAIKQSPDGFVVKIEAVFWWQFEADTTMNGDHANWRPKTRSLFTQFRTDLGKPHLPIIFVRPGLANAYIGNGTAPYWDFIRQEAKRLQDDFQDGSVKMLNIDFVPYPENDWHMTTEKYIEIGNRAGTVFDQMLQ